MFVQVKLLFLLLLLPLLLPLLLELGEQTKMTDCLLINGRQVFEESEKKREKDFLAAIARLTRALRPSSPSPSPSSSSDFSKLPLSLLIVKSRKIVDLQSVQCCEASVCANATGEFVSTD